ncbi:RHS repeat-associated core domain-containing protein, partial [Capnocytophaga sputigena]|uniref:RHS repeat domain-containing protein n=1 Tax=Capnocytophaga sputigena TaxID=1019 RepID=UPI0031EAD477
DLGINPKSTGKGFLYTWNANGSLRSVTDLKGVTYRFRYDAFGRRLEKRRMASTFRFVWDGNVLLHETFKKDNSEHTELTTWVFEGFVPTAKLVNGKAYSIISDHLGTPILAVDSEGNEVWNRQLDIYGRVRKEYKHSSLGDEVFPFVPFLYQGQYYDFETRLCYNRFRYYSPETGAYISQDPIGLASANPTLYGYVGDPNILIDFFGLDSKFLFRADDNYRGGDIGNPLGEKDADIKDLYTHIQDKKTDETSIYTSFSENRSKVTPKFGSVVIKVSLDELRKLEAEGKIKIYTPEDVESIVGGKKGKNAAKTMRNNNEVLIEGNIPKSLIQRCN